MSFIWYVGREDFICFYLSNSVNYVMLRVTNSKKKIWSHKRIYVFQYKGPWGWCGWVWVWVWVGVGWCGRGWGGSRTSTNGKLVEKCFLGPNYIFLEFSQSDLEFSCKLDSVTFNRHCTPWFIDEQSESKLGSQIWAKTKGKWWKWWHSFWWRCQMASR